MNKADRKRFDQCASVLGAHVFFDASDVEGPYSCVPFKEVHITANEHYAAGMHELGHIATTPPGTSSYPPDMFYWECLAWEWAINNFDRKLAAIDRQIVAFSLGTYMVASNNQYGMYPVQEPAEEPIKFVAKRIGEIDFLKSTFIDTVPPARKYDYLFAQAWNFLLSVAK